MSFERAGDWADILKFIYEIETGPEFIVIDNVLLSEGAEGVSALSLTLDVSTYFRASDGHER
jgi:hypothetical protein